MITQQLQTGIQCVQNAICEIQKNVEVEMYERTLKILEGNPSDEDIKRLKTSVVIRLRNIKDENLRQAALDGFRNAFEDHRNVLDQFEDLYTKIPVHLPNGSTINVRTPYHINVDMDLYQQRVQNRNANEWVKNTLRGLGADARLGKSSPEDMQRFLQNLVDSGLLGEAEMNEQALYGKLLKFGVGVDCSGYVSQALNDLYGQDIFDPLNTGSRSLSPYSSHFDSVPTPGDLQAGDTMYLEPNPIGHIRMINEVREENGYIVMQISESTVDGEGGVVTRTWRYPADQNNFSNPQRLEGGVWIDSGEEPLMGRYGG